MICLTTGSMFDQPFDIRVNTVNCMGVMGTGVALAFKERYPAMYRDYRQACIEGRVRPGEISVWRTLTEWIVNFPTKRHWRNPSTYEDISAGLVSLRSYLSTVGPVRVALPALGCGHGGLDWARVRPMVEQALDDLSADVHVFAPGDSVAVGEAARVRKGRTGRKRPEASSQAFTAAPRHVGKGGISATLFGAADLWDTSIVALWPSELVLPREAAAATACARSLMEAGVTLSVELSSPLAQTIASLALASGGAALFWAPARGQSPLAPPIADLFGAGRAAIVQSENHQHTKRFLHVYSLQAAIASAMLLTSPEPTLPYREVNLPFGVSTPVFFLTYGPTESSHPDHPRFVGARPIGRNSNSGRPNVSAILEAAARLPRDVNE